MTETSVSRREFLKQAWQGATALVVASLGYVGWRFMDSRTSDEQVGKRIVVGNPEAFLLGSVTPFPEDQFFLVRASDGGFLALSRQCTHLACTVLLQDITFRCPCHGSEFDHTGWVINPPASDPLWRYMITIEDNRIVVDTRHKLKRGEALSSDFVYAPESDT